LHQPHNLTPIRVLLERRPELPQVACFDTAFHHRNPPVAQMFALPEELTREGVRRYGFHGLSYDYIASVLPQHDAAAAAGRTIVLHLGNGSSMCALEAGTSVASTMGFTAVEGLMMGTRSGSLDPGVILYLLDEKKMDARAIERLIYQQSGLLGVSGLSSDMRDILVAINQGHPRARLAFDVYVHRLRSGIGAMVAVLGGIDALVFTAGAGENSPELRAAACEQLGFLGLKLDRKANAQPSLDQDIATGESQVRVLVIRAQEDWAIARECWKLARVLADWSDTAEPAGTFRS
jgi:acetate kinase